MSDAPEPAQEVATEDVLWPASKPTTTVPVAGTILHQTATITVRTVPDPQPTAPGESAADTRPTDEQVLYRGGPVAREVQRRAPDLWLEMELTEEEQQAVADDYVAIQRETGLDDPLMRRITELHLDRAVASVRRARTAEAAEEGARLLRQFQADAVSAREQVRAKHRGDAADLLARKDRYVAAHPRLAQILDEHGLRDDPEIVMGLVHHVLWHNLGRA